MLYDFRSNWSPFLLILNLFEPSFSQNLRSNWVNSFFMCWTRLPNIWWSTPHPHHPGTVLDLHVHVKRYEWYLDYCESLNCNIYFQYNWSRVWISHSTWWSVYTTKGHTLTEESSQANVILQYKLLASILSAMCSVIQQS